MADYKDLDRKVIKLCKQVIRMCAEAGSSQASSSLSLAHIVTALMYRVMRYEPRNPWHPGSDRLVLSEGHTAPILYAAYCDLGGVVGQPNQASELRFNDALTLRSADSVLDGHPNPAIGFPFFDTATGSLGQGLSAAAGLALGARLSGSAKRIFCICGDGESREGQIWEAVDFIVDQNLTGVYMIFNCNGQGQSDPVSSQQSVEALTRKLGAFGLEVKVIDGHNWEQLFSALGTEPAKKPVAILAKTVKGWPAGTLSKSSSNGRVLSSEEADAALADLDAKANELGVADLQDSDCASLKEPLPVSRPAGGTISAGSFSEAMKAAGLGAALEAKKLSTRKAWGAALAAIGKDVRIVSLDGDVKGSTCAEYFQKAHSERFFDAKIAEQNMVSVATGLSATGRIPFVSTFGKFLTRAYDQIEMAAISASNVKFVGSHSGISLAADGPSQLGLCDLAFFRAFAQTHRPDGSPMIRVFQPSDAVAAFKLTELAANLDGPCYLRTHRPDVAILYGENEEFTLDGFKHLVDGEDIVLVASGYMVHVAKQACELLEKNAGLSAGLIDVYAMPLKTDEILQIGDDCRGQILVIEDNYTGGFADELAAAAAKSDLGVVVESLCVPRMPKSARTPEEMLTMAGLTAQDIARKAQSMFDRS
jgi:transketolase